MNGNSVTAGDTGIDIMYRPDFVGRKRQMRRGSYDSACNPPTTARASYNHRAPPKPSDNTSCAPRPPRAHTQHTHTQPPTAHTLRPSTTSLPSSHTTAVGGVVAAEAAAGRATAPAPEPASDPNPHARARVSHWNLKHCGH